MKHITVNLVEKLEFSPKELRVLRQLTQRNREYLVGTSRELLGGLLKKNVITETITYHRSAFDQWANCKALRKDAIVTHRPMTKVYLNERGDTVIADLKKRRLL